MRNITHLAPPVRITSYGLLPAGIVQVTQTGTTGRAMLATLIEGNTVANSQDGIGFSTGVDSALLHHNTMVNVKVPLDDRGSTDTVSLPSIS